MKKIVGALTVSILLWSCGNEEQKNQHANKHMHQSTFEELVERFEDPKRAKWQKPEIVIEKLGKINGKTIADIGAGTGYFSRRLAQKGAKVLALDVDSLFLDYIDKNSADSLNIVTRKIPFNSPQLDSAEVDAVVIIDTYHHIESRYDYFRDVWRGMKAGGQLMVVDFKKEKTPEGPPVDMRIEGFKLMRELQDAGFIKVVIDVHTLQNQYIIMAKKYENAT